jgi:hypothetical protein
MEGIREACRGHGLRCQDMVYIPSFINIGSAIQIADEGDTQAHRQQGDL